MLESVRGPKGCLGHLKAVAFRWFKPLFLLSPVLTPAMRRLAIGGPGREGCASQVALHWVRGVGEPGVGI